MSKKLGNVQKMEKMDTHWIVSFIEGDGFITYTISKRGPDQRLIVVQADPIVLYKQQAHFGFGSVFQTKLHTKV